MRILSAALIMLAVALPIERAAAGNVAIDGFIDFRTVVPSDSRSWQHGGLGKLRFDGSGGKSVDTLIPQIMVQPRVQILPDLSFVALFRYAPDQRTTIDMIEGFVRYRPVSLKPWRVSVKLGAFFPPISLENTDIGWTSPWTISSSAINSWVGEELRTVGGEVTFEWRRASGDILVRAGAFGWNDPAGILLADRGWALGDRPTGFFERLRLPDPIPLSRGLTPPMYTLMFKEIDATPGWYAGLAWQKEGLGKIELLRYDNEADPSAFRTQFAWRTAFWSAGVKVPLGQFEFLGQAMTGKTIIAPFPTFTSFTRYQSAYALLGWTRGPIRLAARAELFGTVEHHPLRLGPGGPPDAKMSEHGNALTLAANWLPAPYVKFSAELLRVDSFRSQREVIRQSAHTIDNQLQFNARFFF